MVCYHASLSGRRPDIAAEWHPTKNGTLKPDDVTVGNGTKVWWCCYDEVCGCAHEWVSAICSRTRGSKCPYHLGRKVCRHNSLSSLRPDLAVQWHPTKNGTLTPENISPNSDKMVWWYCTATADGTIHEWTSRVFNRTNGNGCPHCSTNGYSKAAIRWLTELSVVEGVTIQTAISPGGERRVRRVRGRCYRIDGYHAASHTALEFHGTIWHGDPRHCDPTASHPITGIRYSEIYKRSVAKDNELRSLGYRLIVMWEADYIPGTLTPIGLATMFPLPPPSPSLTIEDVTDTSVDHSDHGSPSASESDREED